MEYVKNLEFEAKPDYKLLITMFKELYFKLGYKDDGIFDWNQISEIMSPLKNKKAQQSSSNKKEHHQHSKNNGGQSNQNKSNPQGADLIFDEPHNNFNDGIELPEEKSKKEREVRERKQTIQVNKLRRSSMMKHTSNDNLHQEKEKKIEENKEGLDRCMSIPYRFSRKNESNKKLDILMKEVSQKHNYENSSVMVNINP